MLTPFTHLNDAITPLLNGQIGVLPTDTVYGLSALATNKAAVERVYQVKERQLTKPLIVLIPHFTALTDFGVAMTPNLQKVIDRYWPGPVSLILPVGETAYSYLHCGSQTIAFRMPQKPDLLTVLTQAGPLVSTSANKEGQPTVSTIGEAQKLFGSSVDFYIDEGPLTGKPSTILKLSQSGEIEPVRP